MSNKNLKYQFLTKTVISLPKKAQNSCIRDISHTTMSLFNISSVACGHFLTFYKTVQTPQNNAHI